MIVTVTPNPAIDQTMFVEDYKPGEVNRARVTHLDPAGKGVNASRMTHRLGWPTIAFGFLAGETGRMVEAALDAEGVQRYFVAVPGLTRVNMTVVAGNGESTSIYGPGPEIGTAQLQTLVGLLDFWLQVARVLVLAGSLPPGVPDDWYAGLIRKARAAGITTILDTHDSALRDGLLGRPDVVKPNRAEAQQLLKRELPDAASTLAGARELAARTGGAVVISMGARGAICCRGEEAWHIVPPAVERKSTVGSGDSFVAGLAVALARQDELPQALRLATAAGAATAAASGTSLGSAQAVSQLLPRVTLEAL